MTANGWYDALAAVVQGTGTLALIQPAIAIPPQAMNDQIWALFNNLPPVLTNHNLTVSGGNQFYPVYTSVLSQLTSTALTNFQSVLGLYYPLWQQYLGTIAPIPMPAQLPDVFYAWAMTNAPSVATAGRAAYAGALQDAIFSAQTGALNASLFFHNTPNFVNGIVQLFTQLVTAPGPVTIPFSSAPQTGGQETVPATDGPLGGTATFQRLLTFTNVPSEGPGGWFSSLALRQAYSAAVGGSPWRHQAEPNWQSTFGPNGNMQRFIGSLVIADGIDTSTPSGAPPHKSEQLAGRATASTGVWPLFVPSISGIRSEQSFDDAGNLYFTVAVPVGQPVIIAAFVESAAQYIGS